MDVEAVAGADIPFHLPQRFQKWLRFDIPDRAANLHQHDFRAGSVRNQMNPPLDFIGDMRDYLNCASQIVAPPLFGEHLVINLPGGHIADPVQTDIDEPLVMSQIQIGFCAVI